MKLKPLHDRVIVKVLEADRQSAGGILIPDNAAEKPTTGTVLAVGAGRTLDTGQVLGLTVQVNDQVMFGRYSGQTVRLDGEEVVVLREEDIFAVIEK